MGGMPYAGSERAASTERPAGKPTDAIRLIAREASLAQQVAAGLEQLIAGQRFRPGERLPSEWELAERFGVSRTVVREAVRAGSGTVVRRPSTDVAAAAMSLLLSMSGEATPAKIAEVRRVLEVEIAGLAAARRTADDVGRLAAILQTAADRIEDPDAFVETDVAFHVALADATHNELFGVLLAAIAGVMVEVRGVALRVPGTPERALGFHREIYACIERGDRAAAREAMDRHMDEAIVTMTATLGAPAPEP